MGEQLVSNELTPTLLDHGLAFHAAISKLGFSPDVLAWAMVEHEWQLVMVTSLADRVGALDLYETFFRAQDWGAIPADFDLLRLSIYSPKSEVGIDFESFLSSVVDADGRLATPHGTKSHVERGAFVIGLLDPLVIDGRGVYAIQKSGFSADQDLRRWKRFSQNVEKLAA